MFQPSIAGVCTFPDDEKDAWPYPEYSVHSRNALGISGIQRSDVEPVTKIGKV